jgi:hypothetical protein
LAPPVSRCDVSRDDDDSSLKINFITMAR